MLCNSQQAYPRIHQQTEAGRWYYNRRNEASVSGVAPENTNDDLPCDWSDALFRGELKSNPREDNQGSTRFDLSRYARVIFSAEDTRRSAIGFTLCGSIMRLWKLDRLGGVASQSFNIHEDGLMFVSVVSGFLWMTEKEFGFDPTIHETNGGRDTEIAGWPAAALHLDEVLKRQRCVAGRATTYWKAYRNGDRFKPPITVKDPWESTIQYLQSKTTAIIVSQACNNDVVFQPRQNPLPPNSFYELTDDEEGKYNTITSTTTGRGAKLLFSKGISGRRHF
jgi:hypothetical protein